MTEHRTTVSTGSGPKTGTTYFRASCVKECGWVGQQWSSKRKAEEDGDDHILAAISSE